MPLFLDFIVTDNPKTEVLLGSSSMRKRLMKQGVSVSIIISIYTHALYVWSKISLISIKKNFQDMRCSEVV